MTRQERAGELTDRAAKLRADTKWMTEACAGDEPAKATGLKLRAAVLEFRAMLLRWPR